MITVEAVGVHGNLVTEYKEFNMADGSVSYDSQVDVQNKDTEKFIEEKYSN